MDQHRDYIESEHYAASPNSPLSLYTTQVKRMERELIGREKELRQVQAGLARPEYSNIVLLGEAGSGKGNPDDTPIAVADARGYVPIGDLKVGDYVYGENGQPVLVMGVYHQGLKEVFKVTFSDGTSVLCNDEHLWDVRSAATHYHDGGYSTMTVGELMNAGITRMTKTPQGYDTHVSKWYIPVCQNGIERNAVDLPIDPYILGILIGDGCLTGAPLELSSNDPFVVQQLADYLGTDQYYKRKGCYSYVFLHKPEDGSRYKNWQVKELLLKDADGQFELDRVFGKKSIEKSIPPAYLSGSKEQRFSLLQGLLDTDGTVDQGDRMNCRFSTNSEMLAHDVQQLATSLGIRVTVDSTKRDDGLHKNAEYDIYFILPYFERKKLFRLPRHLKRLEEAERVRKRKFEKHYDDMAIVSIEDMGYEAPMTCIWVDSRRHLYLVGKEHIVTHNTALVQGLAKSDPEKLYLEVDLAKMIADLNDPNEMAARLKDLFSDVAALHEKEGKVVVLFMDEFHQVVQLSAAAVEALKPLLADSGTRGIRVIAATTLKEFNQYIMPNQPLVERLQRVTLSEPGRKATISILKDFAKKYGVADQIVGDSIYDSIYENTNRYIPANAQPRKSILLLDAMIGYHNVTNRPFDKKLLADVIYESEGINVDFRVDAVKIRDNLDAAVYAQRFATSTVSDALQIAVAQIEERSRPMCSLLFTGPSGCGKAVTVDMEVWVTDAQAGHKEKIPAGNIRVGDYLFTRHYEQTRVLGVFPQGLKRVWKVTFSNGNIVECSENHLWGCKYDCIDDHFHIHDTRWLSSYIQSGNTVYVPVLDVEKEVYTRIISVEETTEKKEMVCFYVDDKEHMFSLGNGIVTHNTELTKQLASILFGQDRANGDENQSGNRNLIRLDMTEFSRPESVERFRAELTSRVWERPFSVILLDEIEKACAEVTRMLLPVLDDGRMTDVHGRQVVFTNAYIVMTTNAASEIYETLRNYGISEDDDESIKSLMKYMPLIRRSISSTTGSNKFPPELLGRFDAIVPFQPLSDKTKEKIAESKLRKLSRDVYRKHGAKLTYKKDIINYLVKDAMDPGSDSGGARMVVSKIREEVMTPVAAFLNANPKVRDIAVTVVGDMAHENKHMLESNAHIKVSKLGS